MKSQFFQNVASAIIGGIIVSLFVYFVLADRPGSPSLKIERNAIAVPVPILKEAVVGFATLAGASDASSVDHARILRDLGFYLDCVVEQYTVENYGDEILKRVAVTAKGYKLVILKSQSNVVSLKSDSTSEFEMAPGDVAHILAVTDGSESGGKIYGGGKILISVDNKTLEPTELNLATYHDSPLPLSLLGRYSFLTFMLLGAGIVAVIGVPIGATIEVLTRDNLEFKAKNTQNTAILSAVRLFLYIRRHDRARSDLIRRLLKAKPIT